VKETDITGDAQHQETEAIDIQPSEPTPIEIDDSITTSNTTETFEATDTDTDSNLFGKWATGKSKFRCSVLFLPVPSSRLTTKTGISMFGSLPTSKYIKELKDRMASAYKIASSTTKKAQEHQKDGYESWC
jgi:hypothetical protein